MHPKYRSRLVARGIRLPGGEAIVAPTPSLQAMRAVLGAAVTGWKGNTKQNRDPLPDQRAQISFIDVPSAYFNAGRDPDVDPVYVDLPEGDPDTARDMVGLLLVQLYGARAAAAGWHCEY